MTTKTVPEVNTELSFAKLPEVLRHYLLDVMYRRLGVVYVGYFPTCIIIEAPKSKLGSAVAVLRKMGFYCPGTSISAGYAVDENGVLVRQGGEDVYTAQLYLEIKQLPNGYIRVIPEGE